MEIEVVKLVAIKVQNPKQRRWPLEPWPCFWAGPGNQ